MVTSMFVPIERSQRPQWSGFPMEEHIACEGS